MFVGKEFLQERAVVFFSHQKLKETSFEVDKGYFMIRIQLGDAMFSAQQDLHFYVSGIIFDYIFLKCSSLQNHSSG